MDFRDVEGWTPVYITGKSGFGEVIENKLNDNWVLGTAALLDGLMFWLPDVSLLRKFKEAVGAKLILKYRLRFFIDVEEQLLFNLIPDHEFSAAEKIMISEVKIWERIYLKNQELAV